MKQLSKQSLFWIVFTSWGIIFLATHFLRPALPIDETRYLTVAWEMWSQHNYLVPHLNFEPYSHKPPLLFWLINLSWAVFGTSLVAARLIPFLFGLGTVYLTYRFAKVLWPQQQKIALYSTFVLAGTLAFMAASNIIMFDVLMTFWIVLGNLFLVQTLQQSSTAKYWLGYGICLGFALLAKGPVAFIHLSIIPLIAPLWFRHSSIHWGRWYLQFVLAMLLGSAIILAWVIPAALAGGKEYAELILWRQSAGRVVDSFAHAKPFWFYLRLLPFILFPWGWWLSFWKKLFQDKSLIKTWQIKYLVYWLVIVFIIFSCISGKQLHYMVPLMPAFALLFGAVISQLDENRYWRLNTWLVLILPIAMTAIVFSKGWLGTTFGHQTAEYLMMIPSWLSYVLLAALIICIYWSRNKGVTPQLYACYFVTYVFIMSHLALYQVIQRQDLKVLSQTIQPYKQELAYAQVYRGEIGFIARIDKPIAEISAQKIDEWLMQHPHGAVVIKYNKTQEQDHLSRPILKHSHVIYEEPFRGGTIAVIIYGPASNKK